MHLTIIQKSIFLQPDYHYRPRINVKNLYPEKKPARRTKKPAIEKFCFTFALQFLLFRNSFKLVQSSSKTYSLILMFVIFLHFTQQKQMKH